MVTFRDLQNLKRSEFTEAAKGWREISNRRRIATEQVDNEMVAKIRSQRGKTASAAMRDLANLSENFFYTQTECGVVAVTLDALAEELAAPCRKVKDALEEAGEHGLTIDDEGGVSFPDGVDKKGREYKGGTVKPQTGFLADVLHEATSDAPKVQKAVELAELISSAITEAEEIDQRYSRTLAKLKAPPGLKVTAKMWQDASADIKAVAKTAGDAVDVDAIPKGKSPDANAKWWNSLSPAEQDAYVAVHPAAVGALDGLPTAVRDDANRLVLRQERADTVLALRALDANEPIKYRQGLASQNTPTSAWTQWNEKRKSLQGKLDILSKIQDPYAGKKDVPAHKQLYVLDYDTKGDGKAIIAMGNPDTADHTAIHVPGTTTTLESVPGQLERIDKLQNSAMQSAGKGESVSTVLWLGYDAPEVDTSVTNTGRAEAAAQDLQDFTRGTRVAHGEGRSHLTVLGHSYGSTTVGAAASQGSGIDADDIVAVGSPGMTVKEAKDLQIDPKHVWAGATPQDKIVSGASDLTLGHNPASEEFGAQPMQVNDGGHSSYWNEGQESLMNQGRVIAGLPARTGPYYRRRQVELGPDGHTPVFE